MGKLILFVFLFVAFSTSSQVADFSSQSNLNVIQLGSIDGQFACRLSLTFDQSKHVSQSIFFSDVVPETPRDCTSKRNISTFIEASMYYLVNHT